MAMKHFSVMVWFVILFMAIAAVSQDKKTVPPPPKPTDEGPSLEVTMSFIQAKLNDVGPVNHAAYGHDNATGVDWTNQFASESKNVFAAPSLCRIGYTRVEARDGRGIKNEGPTLPLKDVKDIVLMPREQELKESATAAGHPTWTFKVDPPVFVLKVRRVDKGTNVFDFFDEDIANRVAKAMLHAVELCGGGAKPEPF
jgi:hypothetical protein